MNTGSYLPARGRGSGFGLSGFGSGTGSGSGAGSGSDSGTDASSSDDPSGDSSEVATTSSVMGPTPPPSHDTGSRNVLVHPSDGGSLDATQLAFAAIAMTPGTGTNGIKPTLRQP
jgi:hypothetical protein